MHVIQTEVLFSAEEGHYFSLLCHFHKAFKLYSLVPLVLHSCCHCVQHHFYRYHHFHYNHLVVLVELGCFKLYCAQTRSKNISARQM